MCRLIMEVRNQKHSQYNGETLYELCAGIWFVHQKRAKFSCISTNKYLNKVSLFWMYNGSNHGSGVTVLPRNISRTTRRGI